jgi:hypothetical protein
MVATIRVARTNEIVSQTRSSDYPHIIKAPRWRSGAQLHAIAPYFPPGQNASLKDIYTQRKWLDFYGGVMAHRNGNSAESDLVELSPDYTSGEIANIWDGNDFSERYLLADVLSLDLTEIRQLNCPLIIFVGRRATTVAGGALGWRVSVTH